MLLATVMMRLQRLWLRYSAKGGLAMFYKASCVPFWADALVVSVVRSHPRTSPSDLMICGLRRCVMNSRWFESSV